MSQDQSTEAAFTVAAVARRIGVAPATLRTWARRYGIGPTDHSEGEHRKYSEEDLARLIYMRKLIISGVSPQDAARDALAFVGRSDLAGETQASLDLQSDQQLLEQLLRAVNGMDRELVESGICAHLATHGVESTWHGLLVPLLIDVGEAWKNSGEGIEVEHMLSDVILRILNARISANTANFANNSERMNSRPVLVASIGEETHSLAITALAAALSEKGIAVQFLGARTPKSAINEVVKRSAPPAIFLWAQLKKHADLSFITDLPSIRPKPQVIVGGPGWRSHEVAGVRVAEDLVSACSHIERAVGL